jgi:hypothetical protein
MMKLALIYLLFACSQMFTGIESDAVGVAVEPQVLFLQKKQLLELLQISVDGKSKDSVPDVSLISCPNAYKYHSVSNDHRNSGAGFTYIQKTYNRLGGKCSEELRIGSQVGKVYPIIGQISFHRLQFRPFSMMTICLTSGKSSW